MGPIERWFQSLGMDQQGELLMRLKIERQEEALSNEDELYADFLDQAAQTLRSISEDGAYE